jgi:3-hydroxyacyl-[acyl-carrier protein] dehydratase/trans-2-decenoyl-[acyl-carrier protein] isomerase
LGTGRALGCGEVSFSGQIRPYNKCVRYEIDVRRFQHLKESGASIIIGDGNIFVDEEHIATVKQARTGVFKGISYTDYPLESRNSLGGIMERGK